MMQGIQRDPVALSVFLALFIFFGFVGFFATRWRRSDLLHITEWGLGGRRFGGWVTWFLIGGDFYTAYALIAFPALVYGRGAYGFFAIVFGILIYPFIFVLMPPLWRLANEKSCITIGDIAYKVYDKRALESLVALTVIFATIPYLSIQLIGLREVFAALGLSFGGWVAHAHLPMFVAFITVAIYTYISGLRAPALIAIFKDVMIYFVIFFMVTYVLMHMGGFGHLFDIARQHFAQEGKGAAGGSFLLPRSQILPYASTALGATLFVFMYPHTMTGILSAKSAGVVRRNTVFLGMYTFLQGMIGLMGYAAIALYIFPKDKNMVFPLLLWRLFPHWFVGFAFSAVAIASLVPASIMAIGCANLFARNLWRPFQVFVRGSIGENETIYAKRASVVIVLLGVLVALYLPVRYAVYLQLIGGVIVLQILPTVVGAILKAPPSGRALVSGLIVGLSIGVGLLVHDHIHTVHAFHILNGSFSIYTGLVALAANLVTVVLVDAIATLSKRRITS